MATEADELRAENRRLREQYARIRRANDRRTAVGLSVVGGLAGVAAVAFPSVRVVLVALAGTGLFAAVLTYYLSPERAIPASVGERVYTALADNEAALATELDLRDERIYVPTPDGDAPAKLFAPQRRDYEVPPASALESVLVVTDSPHHRGVALYPSGGYLFEEFAEALPDDIERDRARLADQLADGLVEQFELADSAVPEVGPDSDVTVAVSGSAYGPADRPDHPVASFFGVGFAVALREPVAVEVAETDGSDEYVVACNVGVTTPRNATPSE